MKYYEGNYYHVYNRGGHRQRIFYEEENYRHLVALLEKYSPRYGVVVAAYCLLPNHYHLILRQDRDGNIGSFLRTTFNGYTQRINRMYGHSGTLFKGQAKAKHVVSAEYCLQVVRYVHRNPLHAGLVQSVRKWEFSNYGEWIGLRRGILMDTALRDGFFAKPSEYEKFVEEYSDSEEFEAMGGLPVI